MKKLKASATVELVYIMPVIFLAFIALVYILFYLHDKNIISGAAYETAVVGCQKLRWDEEDTEEQMRKLFRERTAGKLLFFARADAELVIEKDMVTVKARAAKRRMSIYTEQRCSVTKPEKFIRDMRKIHGK